MTTSKAPHVYRSLVNIFALLLLIWRRITTKINHCSYNLPPKIRPQRATRMCNAIPTHSNHLTLISLITWCTMISTQRENNRIRPSRLWFGGVRLTIGDERRVYWFLTAACINTEHSLASQLATDTLTMLAYLATMQHSLLNACCCCCCYWRPSLHSVLALLRLYTLMSSCLSEIILSLRVHRPT